MGLFSFIKDAGTKLFGGGDTAEEQAAKVNPNAILFLQPEWSKKEEMTPLIVDYVMNNPKWRVSLQTHKYLNIP